jgi:hypothetical protein
MRVDIPESYDTIQTSSGVEKRYKGEIEFIIKDRNGNVIEQVRQPNIIKIFAKEILAHRIPHSKVWDPAANAGSGAWVTHSADLDEFSAKYIVFGASFDEEGRPLDTADDRFYALDVGTGNYVPLTLDVGAAFGGGLINPIPISEPTRALKKIERIFFESSYQPSGTPLLQDDVRAINNTVVLETTLRKEEYNGFGLGPGDFFTLTEVALVGAAELESVGACECDPRDIFLSGDDEDEPLAANASGFATISLDMDVEEINLIKEGDQVKITGRDGEDSLDQVNQYYLVLSKAVGGRDITLDRVPVDSAYEPIVGEIGIKRDGFRVFSHRILKSPIKKSEDFEIVVRWRIILN